MMKKIISFFKDSDTVEKVVGGIFGVIALIAIAFEMAMGGFDKAAIIGGIKDIAGTSISIVMLFVAIKALSPKKEKQEGFTEAFIHHMDILIEKYSPILSFFGEEQKAGENTLRYNIANRLDAVATNNPGGSHKLFRITEGAANIDFSVSETVFPQKSGVVSATISRRIIVQYAEVVQDVKTTKEGFSLIFKKPLCNEDDARIVADLIDYTVLLFIAEYSQKETVIR